MTDAEISSVVNKLFDMRPKAIVERFGLKNPIFGLTAAYGHMGRNAYSEEVELNTVEVKTEGEEKHEIRRRVKKQLDFFSWEKLDYVDKIQEAFGIR